MRKNKYTAEASEPWLKAIGHRNVYGFAVLQMGRGIGQARRLPYFMAQLDSDLKEHAIDLRRRCVFMRILPNAKGYNDLWKRLIPNQKGGLRFVSSWESRRGFLTFFKNFNEAVNYAN